MARDGRQRATWVWRAGRQAFGSDWNAERGQEPPRVWIVALEKLQDSELRRGLLAFAEGQWTYPPNVGKFVQACRPDSAMTRAWQARLEQAERERAESAKSLEHAATRSAAGRQWLAYWWLRGIRLRPSHVTMAMLDEMLSDADLDAMDAKVERASSPTPPSRSRR